MLDNQRTEAHCAIIGHERRWVAQDVGVRESARDLTSNDADDETAEQVEKKVVVRHNASFPTFEQATFQSHMVSYSPTCLPP